MRKNGDTCLMVRVSASIFNTI